MKSKDPKDTNYMFFMKEGKFCIDASKECSCHSRGVFMTTLGRGLNHSRKNFNVKAKKKTLDRNTVILLEATRCINKDEELLFDYGVKTGEDGKQIDWLKQ
ncbi:hypothetical protein DPMN_085103 [Dreissena polymorpha]|uniref:SET domain-containing protein n=1 Tax=Dreissena polymorpha TaxID=45954 RepID=A0A9D4BJ47_DREPO|nr:hypothetical protein DPMN_085103 [Dreissena polymorpha]